MGYMKRIFTPICAGIVLLLSGCAKLSLTSDDELELNVYELHLFYDETFQFEITKGGEPASISGYKGTSSDTLVGYLDEASPGRFVAKRIGATTVTYGGGKNKATAEVIIEPYHTLFEEPYLGFGASMGSVKSNEFRSAGQESSDYIWYHGENPDLFYVDYSFDEAGLYAVFLDISSAGGMMDKLLVFYKERYDYLDRYENGWWFEDRNRQLYVVVNHAESTTKGGILVTYFQDETDEVMATMSAGRVARGPASGNLPQPHPQQR